MVRHTLKILQQMLEDFKSVPDHFGTLCIKGLRTVLYPFPETHYGPSQAPKMDLFTEIVNSYILKKVEKSIMDKLL